MSLSQGDEKKCKEAIKVQKNFLIVTFSSVNLVHETATRSIFQFGTQKKNKMEGLNEFAPLKFPRKIRYSIYSKNDIDKCSQQYESAVFLPPPTPKMAPGCL